MKASELLTEIKAREELEARGWSRKTCETCQGSGSHPPKAEWSLYGCMDCGGRGFNWVAPITK